MHELSLAAGMLEIVGGKVQNRAALREVHVTVGPLSGVCPEALQFGFDEMARQLGYENVSLVVARTPAVCLCTACGVRYEVEDVHEVCSACGSLERTIESGDEFLMDSLEVDEE